MFRNCVFLCYPVYFHIYLYIYIMTSTATKLYYHLMYVKSINVNQHGAHYKRRSPKGMSFIFFYEKISILVHLSHLAQGELL